MKQSAALWGLALALAAILGVGLVARRSQVKQGSGSPNDLAMVFLGLTNAPRLTLPVLAVSRAGDGLYALFGLTNQTAAAYLRYRTVGVERADGTNWIEFVSLVGWPTNYWRGVGGSLVPPGMGWIAAVPWPTGLAVTNRWRLRLEVGRERNWPLQVINQWLGKEVFTPRSPRLVQTPTVAGPLPVWGEETKR